MLLLIVLILSGNSYHNTAVKVIKSHIEENKVHVEIWKLL